jgi:hypothetical protein
MEQNSQARTITSQNTDYPLSFRSPEGWEVRVLAVPDAVKFSLRGPTDSKGRLFASVTVRAWPAEDHTPSQLARQWIEGRSAFRTFRILARTETTVAGVEAMQIDAAHDMPLPLRSVSPEMVPVQERVIFALHEGVAYQLTYRLIQDDFQKHLPAFEGVVASLSLERER